MSDAGDALDAARIKIKKAAAAMLARKEALEAELERLEKDRARAEGDPELEAELDARIAVKSEERDVAESDYAGAMKELGELKSLDAELEKEQQRAVVRGATAQDPFATSPVDVALENVRKHIDELEARVSLDADLDQERRGRAQADRAQKEADAKAQLEALKAKRRGGGAASGGDDAGDGDQPSGPPKKRTL